MTARLHHSRNSRQKHCKGDERGVNGNNVYSLTDVRRIKEAGVQLNCPDPGLIAQFPIELFAVHVQRIHAVSAIQKQAVGEASGGRADVEANRSLYFKAAGAYRTLKFHAAA